MAEYQPLEFKNHSYIPLIPSGTNDKENSYSLSVNAGEKELPALGHVNNWHTIACACCSCDGNLLGRAGWGICP